MTDAAALPQWRQGEPMSCTHRGPEDDFFCLRYRVWYPSIDCAFRTKHRTATGCLGCEQGRFNLKRHAAELGQARPRPAPHR